MSVCSEHHSEIVRWAEAGLTGHEIALKLGVTRNAVLGHCHRRGIRLPMTARKQALRVRKPRGPRPASRGNRKHYPHRFRVAAVAAFLCGKSYAKVGDALGCYDKSIYNWARQSDIRAEAQAIADRVRAELAEKAATLAAQKAQEAADRRALIDEINAPILARMPARHRAIMERRINGVSLQGIGDDFGVTRERVRQIEVKWRGQGLVIPDARPLSDAGRKIAARLNPKPRPPRRVPDNFWTAAQAVVERECKPKARYRLSDAERRRRSEWMREVCRRRWEARA